MNTAQRELNHTARITGIWYLLLAVSGMLGFLIFHPRVFVSDDPAKTLSNLTSLETVSRIRILCELVIIVSQTLAAVWFYRLFRNIHADAAWAIGIWGMMNAAAIMISAIAMGTALQIAQASLPATQEKVGLIQLLTHVSTNAWGVGGLFFGLWLIPMGYAVIHSKRMPLWLGRVLIIGGLGYILHTFLRYTGINHPLLELMVIPATIGEFWMIAYLLVIGIRPLKDASG